MPNGENTRMSSEIYKFNKRNPRHTNTVAPDALKYVELYKTASDAPKSIKINTALSYNELTMNLEAYIPEIVGSKSMDLHIKTLRNAVNGLNISIPDDIDYFYDKNTGKFTLTIPSFNNETIMTANLICEYGKNLTVTNYIYSGINI